MQRFPALRLHGALLLLAGACWSFGAVPRAAAFPVERMPAEQRAEAEALLLRAMDREALYTLIGGIKPMSSGISGMRMNVDTLPWQEAERLRQLSRIFDVPGEIEATVQPFWRINDRERFLELVVFHRPSFQATVRAEMGTFGFYGVTPSSEPVQVLLLTDVDQTPRRNRAYGYLFGYPEYAVDFFVRAEESRRRDGQFVQRDFLHIPTFESPTNRFVYAVPKCHTLRPEDLALRERSAPIFAYYQHLRPQYIGEGKRGIVTLLRDWMDDGKGRVSSATAEAKARAWFARQPAASR